LLRKGNVSVIVEAGIAEDQYAEFILQRNELRFLSVFL
jgi:hypothetical protein